MSTISSLKRTEIKYDVYKFCETLREHAMKIINFRKEKIELLINEPQDSQECAKIY